MRLPHPISQQVFVRLRNLLTISLTITAIVSLLSATPARAAQTVQLTCSAGALKFGAVALGETETQLVTLTNTGAGTVTLSEINLSNAEFNVPGASLPIVLASGQSADVSITFSPTVSGYTGGSIAFISNAANPTLKLAVSGTGDTSPSITASPSNISFGAQPVGSVSTVPVVLTNTRKFAVSINGMQTNGAVFSVSGPTLPLSLPAGQSVTFTVAFAPQLAGTTGGSIFVQGPAVSIPLAGSAVAAGELTIAPAGLSFGNVNVGSTGNETVTLSAAGAAVTVSSGASSSSQFALAGVSFPFTIAAGQSVALDVTFTPQNSGTASGALSFASNAANNPGAESVSGTGVTPVYSVGLTWNAVSDVMGYNVYRGAAATGPFSKINSTLNSDTAYSDTTVVSGQTYYYVTTAVNSSNVESAPSTPAEAQVP